MAERYERLYRPFCDLAVMNHDLQDAIATLYAFVKKVRGSTRSCC